MKNKSARCSTGHGTGVLQERSLRMRLAKWGHPVTGKRLWFRKKLGLPVERQEPRGRHDHRGRSMSRRAAEAARAYVANFDMREAWKGFLRARFGKPLGMGPRGSRQED